MGLSSILEVALGMVLIYYVLGLVVSYITNEIKERLEIRAKDLAHELKILLGAANNREIYDKFMLHPLIQSLAPKQAKLFGNPKLRPVADIPPERAALVLLDILFPGKEAEKLLGEAEIKEIITTLPEGELKQALQKLLNDRIFTIHQTAYLIEQMFNDTLETVASVYKQHIRQVVVIFALVVTLVTGVDSVEVGQRLWVEPTLRADLAAQANRAAEAGEGTGVTAEDLQRLNIPLFWSGALPTSAGGWAWKIAGLLITWLAVAQGSSFWYQILRQIRSSTEASDSERKVPAAPILAVPPASHTLALRTEPSSNGSPPILEEGPPKGDTVPEEERLVTPEVVEVIDVDEKLVQLARVVLDKLQAKRPNSAVNLKLAAAQLKIEAARADLNVTTGQLTAALEAAIQRRQDSST